ncbi:MAG: prepilin peptidase [Myxococcota bacterium]
MSESVHSIPLATPRGLRVPGASHAIAVLVGAGLLFTAREAPLPALGGAAAFLLLAVEQDVRRMRIPNWLTAPALLCALAWGGFSQGAVGFGSALLGAAAGFAILFVPFFFRWLGAGDVKAVMVLGALFGVELLLPVLWWMVVVGGVLALAVLAGRGGFMDLLLRWRDSARVTFATRRWTYFGPQAGTVAAGGIPFAVAMGLGAAAFQLWGTPWV